MPVPAFPLRVSASRRFLEDSSGHPFFVHADTGWRLLNALDRAEALHYLGNRRRRGFNALHIHAANREREGSRNRAGHEPFADDDLTRPNEAYWAHADGILRDAAQHGFFVLLSAVWFGSGGAGWRRHFSQANADAYGRFLGARFRDLPNLAWILGGDNGPGDRVQATRTLSRALREEAPHHLQTYHAGPEHASAFWFTDEDWLDFNAACTYAPAHLLVHGEYDRAPTRPIYLIETGYEGESNTGFGWSANLVRRQAYAAICAGACGHASGSARVWDFGSGWREALDRDATRHLKYLRDLVESHAWWKLVPDRAGKLITRGRASFGATEDIVAAVAHDRSWALAHVPVARPFSVDLSLLGAPVYAFWFDPTAGKYLPVAGAPFHNAGRELMAPPAPRNSAGDSDWVLVLEAAG
jgi:hypothetical protein